MEVAAQLGCLPVRADNGATLVGIVTQSDLFGMLARLLGADQPGARLEPRLDDVRRKLADLAALAVEHGVDITSLVTLPRVAADGSDRRVVLRIGSTAAQPVVVALERAGIAVADSRPADA